MCEFGERGLASQLSQVDTRGRGYMVARGQEEDIQIFYVSTNYV